MGLWVHKIIKKYAVIKLDYSTAIKSETIINLRH